MRTIKLNNIVTAVIDKIEGYRAYKKGAVGTWHIIELLLGGEWIMLRYEEEGDFDKDLALLEIALNPPIKSKVTGEILP
jgi:hypothetical protein